MLIYLIRHGETDFNLERRYQGMYLESHLTDAGRAQARAASPLYRDIPFSRIYVSSSERTRETASLLFPERNDFIFRDDLRETDVGELAGNLISEFEEKFGERYHLFQKTRDYSIFGGESREALLERARSAIDAILADGDGNVAIVTHGGTVRVLLTALTGISPYAVSLLPNCSFAAIEYKDGVGALKQYGFTAQEASASEAL